MGEYYNSSKPATAQAFTYTHKTDIHVTPSQEKYPLHEEWHVAQQMADRISPTTNIKSKLVNDNAALENEADAIRDSAIEQKNNYPKDTHRISKNVLQLYSHIDYTTQEVNYSKVIPISQTSYITERATEIVGKHAHAELDPSDRLTGSGPARNTHKSLMDSIKVIQHGKKFIKGHLMNDHLGGIGEWYNLFPISDLSNKNHLNTAEAMAKEGVKEGFWVFYDVDAKDISNNISENPHVCFDCTVEIRKNPSDIIVYKASITSEGCRGTDSVSESEQGRVKSHFKLNNGLKKAGTGESLKTKQSRIQSTVIIGQNVYKNCPSYNIFYNQSMNKPYQPLSYNDFLLDAIYNIHDFYLDEEIDLFNPNLLHNLNHIKSFEEADQLIKFYTEERKLPPPKKYTMALLKEKMFTLMNKSLSILNKHKCKHSRQIERQNQFITEQ